MKSISPHVADLLRLILYSTCTLYIAQSYHSFWINDSYLLLQQPTLKYEIVSSSKKKEVKNNRIYIIALAHMAHTWRKAEPLMATILVYQIVLSYIQNLHYFISLRVTYTHKSRLAKLQSGRMPCLRNMMQGSCLLR